ncbi:MAG: hypothetical protein MMC23_008309 [Stictis urceolatum]|nr:hypothetical protein [Stictis urceolata]
MPTYTRAPASTSSSFSGFISLLSSLTSSTPIPAPSPSSSFTERRDLIWAEYIPPLPLAVRKALINLCFPPPQRSAALSDPENTHCLVRPYVGIRRPRPVLYSSSHPTTPLSLTTNGTSTPFSLRNFELDLTTLTSLSLLDEATDWARGMAATLAVLHWEEAEKGLDRWGLRECVDGVGVRKKEEGARRAARLWLLDFDRCVDLMGDEEGRNEVGEGSLGEEAVQKAVRAFWVNDPYFPRPEGDGVGEKRNEKEVDGDEDGESDEGSGKGKENEETLWDVFKRGYLRVSVEEGIADKETREKKLPELFIEGVERVALDRNGSCGSKPPLAPVRGEMALGGKHGEGRVPLPLHSHKKRIRRPDYFVP